MTPENAKRFDPGDSTLKFVRKKDDITVPDETHQLGETIETMLLLYLLPLTSRPGDEDDVLRVEMSCEHAVDPNSLTGWCRSLLDQGQIKFHCPAVVGDNKKCGKEWTYVEIRRHALLTDEEQHTFETKIATIAAKMFCDYKECPGCKSFVERKDLANLRVLCVICKSMKNNTAEFCWQCLKPWKGSGTSSLRCENEECADLRLKLLENCPLKDLPGSEIKNCPSIRACPTCGVLIEHKDMCKYMMCKQCQVEFCFACLESAKLCQANKAWANYLVCSKPVAPRQTKIPVWSRRVQQSQPSFTAPPAQTPAQSEGSWCSVM